MSERPGAQQPAARHSGLWWTARDPTPLQATRHYSQPSPPPLLPSSRRNRRSSRLTAAGCSQWTQWPAFSKKTGPSSRGTEPGGGVASGRVADPRRRAAVAGWEEADTAHSLRRCWGRRRQRRGLAALGEALVLLRQPLPSVPETESSDRPGRCGAMSLHRVPIAAPLRKLGSSRPRPRPTLYLNKTTGHIFELVTSSSYYS